jgi:predicted ATP-grasp superfamily ATP-dependent carboligase
MCQEAVENSSDQNNDSSEMTSSWNPRPVLILGASPRITVPVARSLHAHGIRVEVACFQQDEPNLTSRAIHKFHRLPPRRNNGSDFLRSLLCIIRERQFDMLLPAGDPALAAVRDHYQDLSGFLKVGAPTPPAIDRVLRKPLTLEAAQRCGISTPTSFTVTTIAELTEVATHLRFPVVAKPQQKGAASFRVSYFDNLKELSAALKENNWGAVLLQEYCPGMGVGIEMLVHKDECVAAFQHRRLKESPSTGGVAVLAMSEPLDRVLAQVSLSLLRRLGWDGVAMVEFRKNFQTGQTVLMEVNGRYWGSCSLAILAGVDFPFYQWQLAHGEEPRAPGSYRVGMLWRWTPGYVEHVHGILARTGARVGRQFRRGSTLRDIPRAFSPRVYDALWSWRDPRPAWSELFSTLWHFTCADLRWAMRRFTRKPVTAAKTSTRRPPSKVVEFPPSASKRRRAND